MIAAILLALASICDACMDTLLFHYYTSVFNRSGDTSWTQWWNPEISWKNKYYHGLPTYGKRKILFGAMDVPVFLTDAWHAFKSLKIFTLALQAYFTYVNWNFFEITNMPFVNFGVYVVAYGLIWNSVFNLFYNHLLLKK